MAGIAAYLDSLAPDVVVLEEVTPSGLPALLRIRIDHCLATTAVSVASVRVGGSLGSDHLATINELLVANPSQMKTPP